MVDTTFVHEETVIDAGWLNDVNRIVYGDDRAVKLSGDIMTGDLSIIGMASSSKQPTADEHLTRKDYVVNNFFNILTVLSVSVSYGGSAYTIGDIITLNTGIAKTKAEFIVTSVSAGVIAGLGLTKPGTYLVFDIVNSVPVTGGSGSGCLVDITIST